MSRLTTLVVLVAFAASTTALPLDVKLSKASENPRQTLHEKMMSLSHAMHKLFADHPKHGTFVRNVHVQALKEHNEVGRLSPRTLTDVANVASAFLTPAAAARANLEITADDLDHAAGEGAEKGKQLEEGGSMGEDYADATSVQGDMHAGDNADIHKHALRLHAAGAGHPWDDRTLSYCFEHSDGESTADVKKNVAIAAERIKEAVPCLNVVNVGRDPNDNTKCSTANGLFITFQNAGCWSGVGMDEGGGPNT